MRFVIILALLLGFAAPVSAATFEQWKVTFAQKARGHGITSPVIATFLREAQFLPKVIELDRAQPERKKTFMEYYSSAVSGSRIGNGRQAYRENARALENAANRYGVPPQVITALWGMETSYGGYTGDWGVLSTLATLAYEGRRAEFFGGELLAAMQIIDSGIPASQMRGSWAGAMGQCQFMPSSYIRLAQDGNGDGKRDIWNNRADVFASAANYLSKNGWQKDLPWGTRAKMARPLAGALEGTDQGARTLEAWRNVGVVSDGPLRVLPTTPLWLVIPDCPKDARTCEVGAAYLVTQNFKVIKRWNNSSYFAISVGRLSDEIAQIPAGYSTPHASRGIPATDNRPTSAAVLNQ